MATPELYQKQSFNDFARQTFFGNKELNRKQTKKLNKYLNSEQGQAAALAHEKRESQKYLDSWDARLKAYMDAQNASHNTLKKELTKNLNDYKASVAAQETDSETDPETGNLWQKEGWNDYNDWKKWYDIAVKYGFENTHAVKTWQQQNGLAADGKFGKQSIAKWNALKNPTGEKSGLVSKTAAQQTVSTTPITREQLLNTNYFRPHRGFQKTVVIDGVRYPVIVTKGLDENNEYGLKNDQSYALDTNTGMIRELNEDGFGALSGGWANKNGNWLTINNTLLEKKSTPKVTAETLTENHIYKQGGTMKTKYFQQGGAAPQQDMQQQVIALVQAAMQGDQKATETVNKIMEAAKAGDQQAMQIAQMIQAVAEQMQGQATAAKWGAKLNYIRSLKYAKGGKTCPTCNQKIEMKKCGGKKAKKKYFGGWL